MRTIRQPGMLLLGIWLILFGLLTQRVHVITFHHSHDVLAVGAIVAGLLCVLRR